MYKYPQSEFPYAQLVEENARRTKSDAEYEILDTGVFDDNRYFDVFVEYAKADVDETLIQITICNRGEEEAELHLLPTLWFRNTWAWGYYDEKPIIEKVRPYSGVLSAKHHVLGKYFLHCASV